MRSSWSASCARVRLDHPDKDVTWLSPAGEEMATEQWEDGNARCFGMLLDGRAQESGVKRRGSDATLMTDGEFHAAVGAGGAALARPDRYQPARQPRAVAIDWRAAARALPRSA